MASLRVGKAARVFSLVTLLFAASAFSKEPLRVEFQASPEQSVTFQHGVQFVTELTGHSVVELANVPDQLPDKQTTFRVSIGSDAPVTFGPEDIWLEFGNGKRVAMLSYDELAGRFRRDLKRRRALAALGGALSESSANGYTSGSVTYSGMTSNGTIYSGTGIYSGYDPALAQQQQAQANAQSVATERAIQSRQMQGTAALDGMLRRTSVQPFELVEGIVAFDPPRDLISGSEVIVVVRLGDEEHRIKTILKKP